MKKLLMAVMLFCGVISGFAQSKGDFRIGPTVGMNVAKVTDGNVDCRIGFNLGARVDYGFTNNVYLASGLILSQKGYKVDDTDISGRPLYLNIPIHIGYTYSLGNVVSIFGETGPYLGFGVGGKEKFADGDDFGVSDEYTEVDYFGDDAANVFDMGWGFRLGVEANRFQIHMGYEYGFTKVFDEGSNHNSNFTVGVSYMF